MISKLISANGIREAKKLRCANQYRCDIEPCKERAMQMRVIRTFDTSRASVCTGAVSLCVWQSRFI